MPRHLSLFESQAVTNSRMNMTGV